MSSLDHDRRHIERLYKRLDAERAGAEAELVAAQRATGSSPGEMSLREAAVRALGARLARLRAGADGLCFGRMDAADGSRTYVGRTGLRDDEHEPVLIDRRARAARPFYCATAAHPEGLLRRRHFVTRGRRVLDARTTTCWPARTPPCSPRSTPRAVARAMRDCGPLGHSPQVPFLLPLRRRGG